MKAALRLTAHLTYWNRAAFAAGALTACLGTAALTGLLSSRAPAAFLPLGSVLLVTAPLALVLFDLLLYLGLQRLRRQGRAEYTLKMIPGAPCTYLRAIACTALFGLIVLGAATVLGVLLARLIHIGTGPAAVRSLLALTPYQLAQQQISGELTVTGALPTALPPDEAFYAFTTDAVLRLILPPTLVEALMTLGVALCHSALLVRVCTRPRAASAILTLAAGLFALQLVCRWFAQGHGLLFPILLLLCGGYGLRAVLRDDRELCAEEV